MEPDAWPRYFAKVGNDPDFGVCLQDQVTELGAKAFDGRGSSIKVTDFSAGIVTNDSSVAELKETDWRCVVLANIQHATIHNTEELTTLGSIPKRTTRIMLVFPSSPQRLIT